MIFKIYLLVISIFSISLANDSISESTILDSSTIKGIEIAVEEYPPYTSEFLKYNGLDCRIIKEAFLYENINVQFNFYPGARAYFLAQTGKVEGSAPWAMREGREIDFHYSAPLRKADREFLFYTSETELKWDPEVQDFSTLENLRFGAMLGYNYGPVFETAEAENIILVDRVSTLSQNIRKLQRGNIDLFISQYRIAKHTLYDEFTPEEIGYIKWTPENNDTTGYDYLLISKAIENGPELIELFNRGLKKLQESGRYEQFLTELDSGGYILSDEE